MPFFKSCQRSIISHQLLAFDFWLALAHQALHLLTLPFALYRLISQAEKQNAIAVANK